MTVRNMFEKELMKLNESLEEMFHIVASSYDALFDALAIKDEAAIQRIIRKDADINEMERRIESMCLNLITKQQPIARDLRLVSAALKVVTDIERVGDHVSDIAELLLRLEMKDLSEFSPHLSGMIDATRELLDKSVEAFLNRNRKESEEVIREDDVVDMLFNKAKMDLIHYLKTDTKNADECIDVLMLAKYLEKIGDHAVNIGEWEIFQETGSVENIRIL